MKTQSIALGICAFILLAMSSCMKDTCQETQKFIQYDPILVDKEAIHPEIEVEGSRVLENPGKIYSYGKFIFINEQNEGVHVYDNSDVENPVQVAFYSLPGNRDIAIKDGILYANVYFDLVGFDIENIQNPTEVFREEFGTDPSKENDEGQIVVGYNRTNQSIEVDCNDENFGSRFFETGGAFFVDNASSTSSEVVQSPQQATSGQGGSTARFAFIGTNFYLVNNSEMIIYEAADAGSPQESGTVSLGFGIETIFPYGENIFIGANDGMHIYDNSNPLNPVHLSTYSHANACDPVVVNEDKAFVTLRDGNECENFTNQLDVVDLSNLHNPKLIKSYDMRHPIGMATIKNNLYLCDDKAGLMSYDISDVKKIDENLLSQIESIKPFDAILLDTDHLLVIARDGFYQYDCSDPSDLKLLSHIPTNIE